jgi:hypothetical protein
LYFFVIFSVGFFNIFLGKLGEKLRLVGMRFFCGHLGWEMRRVVLKDALEKLSKIYKNKNIFK